MVKTFMRKKSKRQTCHLKYKIDRKVREHKRKERKELKKKGAKKLKKDPGIPNLFPFKEQLLRQLEGKKQQELKDVEKRREQHQREKKMKSLHNLKSDAEKRAHQFDQKKDLEEAMGDIGGLEIGKDSSRKAYYREFKKVVELADVVLEVLDARDPLGCRCTEVEHAVIASGSNKKLILVLNKIDLIPKSNAEDWLKYLRREFPTVPFKASTQAQNQNLARKKMSQSVIPEDVGSSSACFGANLLMKLLGNYCRSSDVRSSITVGIIGVPNVGKSSIINSLKRSKACNVGAAPGITKVMQEVQLDKHIKMLDCPGIVMAKAGDHSSAVLRNCVKVENLADLTVPVEAILQRCNRLKMLEFYCIPEYADVHEFLTHVARRGGRLKKGGVPNVDAAAKTVLHDWNSGRITFYTHPPEQSAVEHQISAEIVSELSKGFDLDSILKEEENILSGLKDNMDSVCVQMESSAPVEMEDLDSSEDGESSDDDDDDDDDDDELSDFDDGDVGGNIDSVLTASLKGAQKVVTVVDMVPKRLPKATKKVTSNTGGPSKTSRQKKQFDADVDMEDADAYDIGEFY